MSNEKTNITQLLKGTSMCVGDDAFLQRSIISTIRTIASNYGYPEMSSPVIYSKELLTYKFEEDTELADEIYTLSDRGGRDLALRYDLTVPFARFVADNVKALSYPFRRFECGDVFRDGPVKSGRARQFTQCDIDVVGDADPVITAYEQMSCALAVFDALGLDDVKIKYSSRRFINGVLKVYGLDDETISSVVRVLDKKDKLDDGMFAKEMSTAGFPLECLDEFNRDWLGADIFDLTKFMADLSILELDDSEPIANKDLTGGIREIIELNRLLRTDPEMSERCVFSPSLVRGQDYYTGIMFEAFAFGYPSSLAGGGRYDSIIASLADVEDDGKFSASGLSFGIVPISFVMKQRALENEDASRDGLAILTCSRADVASALSIANKCRVRMRVDVDATERSVSKKMKSANKSGYRFIIVYGEQERNEGVVKVKDMETGDEVALDVQVLCISNMDDLEIFCS